MKDNESGEVTLEELGKFLGLLLKNQVVELQKKVEQQKYQRSLEISKAFAGLKTDGKPTTPGPGGKQEKGSL